MKANRGWLALLYALVVVLAQGVHDHGGETDETVTRHVAGCDDPGLHLAGHPSADLSHQPLDHCLACQFRADHQGFAFDPPTFDRPALSVAVAVSELFAPLGPSHRLSCRGPPRV